MKDVIEQIIAAGAAAPSGDNCQPWRFIVRPNTIEVYNIPERDQSLYSWGQRASLIAHGALLENIRIAAAHHGYHGTLSLFPDNTQPDLVARMHMEPSQKNNEPLFAVIHKRATNRKPYNSTPLTDAQRSDLLDSANEVNGVQLTLIEDPVKRKGLAQVAAANETILFENRPMHSFFFSHINWTHKDTGMHIDTLELPGPAKLGFKIFQKWNLLQMLNKLGLSALVAMGNAQLYATGAATGAIVLKDRSPEQFVIAGRLFQRIWLKATAMGLALQPLTGIALLMNRIAAGDTKDLSEKHTHLITQQYHRARTILNTSEAPIACMFRIGNAPAPRARTPRQTPSITWLT